jgi:hypothetical protein
MVPSALTNDPMPGCDPQGFPRIVLHNFRTSRIIQTPENVVILYEFNKKWRTIWTDGRQLPKERQRRSRTTVVGLFGRAVDRRLYIRRRFLRIRRPNVAGQCRPSAQRRDEGAARSTSAPIAITSR